MRIACIGGGPAGLYLGILFKLADPRHDVAIYERNSPDDTFGFGVVFSDATLGNLEAADPVTLAAIREHFAHWDAIDTHVGGEVIRSVGHGFCGLERKQLLLILQSRCRELGVELHFDCPQSDDQIRALASDVDLLVGADGLSSRVREIGKDRFEPSVEMGPNRFVWLGTTVPFDAFTFYFKNGTHGLWRIHAYRYSSEGSTFIAECTEETFRATSLAETDEDATIAYLESEFAVELGRHRLVKNRSVWRQFPTVKNQRWCSGNMVLVGDSAHTAHFSIGSGTKLAMEDCIALVAEIGKIDPNDSSAEVIRAGLARYEQARRPRVARLARAAEVSLEWFEQTERYIGDSPLMFTYSLMTRSLRVDHENLQVRDAELCSAASAAFARAHGELDESRPAHQVGLSVHGLVAASRLARLAAGALVLDGGVRIPRVSEADLVASSPTASTMASTTASPLATGTAEAVDQAGPVVCVEIDADEALGDKSSDHRKHVLGSRAQVIVLVTSSRIDEKERGRVIARAVDVVRRDWSVATVAVHPGASTSYLDTLLLAGRADLGVL